MAQRLVYLIFFVLLNVGSFALPIYKRSARHYRTRPVQGVEVNGLFNPMKSLSPQLFERASEYHGNTITTYRDICNLLPQEKLDSLMADHFAKFITNFDLEVLESAHIDTLRIPVSYNMFLPETNRTESFPTGERKALDTFIERAVDYDMDIWLDLIATPNSQLGMLERHGNTVTPDTARAVIKYITKKYDPRIVTTILVHPDIAFPSAPANLSPLNPMSIKKTKNSQYHLYRELASILDKKGHVLAIDTFHNLHWWSRMATSFSSPVVLVHSIQTGVLSTHQQSVTRLVTGIKDEMQFLKDLAKKVAVSVTWDASINACVHGKDGSHDCTLSGQIWQASNREPKRGANVKTLNDYTECFGVDILRELEKIDISAWFFRTAKIQASEAYRQDDIVDESRKLIKRRRPEKIVSGNDFLAMYKYGMFPESLLSHATKHRKSLLVPVAIGLGVAGAGGLGWWLWEDVRKIGNEAIRFFQNPQKAGPIVEKPPPHDHKSPSIDSNQPIEQPTVDLPRTTPDEITSRPEITTPIGHEEPPASSNDYMFPLSDSLKVMAESQDDGDDNSQLIERLDPYSSGLVIHYPFGYPYEGDPAWGTSDNNRNPPVEDLILKWERPPETPVVAKSDAAIEVESLDNRGSVAASVARFETQEISNANSPINRSLRHSFPSTGSEFHLSKSISGKDSQYIRPLSDIQRDFKTNQEQDWTHRIPVTRPRRPGSGLRNAETKRQGKVLSIEEKDLLDQMMLEWMRGEQSRFEEMPKVPQDSVVAKDQSHNEKGETVEDASIGILTADLKSERVVNKPLLDKAFNAESLTHAQQEQYTRPHAGTGEGFPDSTPELTKLRRDTRKRRVRSEPKRPSPNGHHIIGGQKARPMTVHAPRHKDMDPNHPLNLKKMKSNPDEYKPYPPPEAKHTIKTHFVETTKIVSKPKGILGIPSTITVHKKESTQLHPDITTALINAGQEIRPSRKNGIGKDPRKTYEDAYWTEDEREGYLAYVDSVLNMPKKSQSGRGSVGRVDGLASFWTDNGRMKPPETSPSAPSEQGPKNHIPDQMDSLREHPVHQSQNQRVRNTDGRAVREQHAPKGSVSSHIESINEGLSDKEDEAKQSELQDLATSSVSSRIISSEAGSVQSEGESNPMRDQRDRRKEPVLSLSGSFEEASVRDDGRSRLVYNPKGSLSGWIWSFEQGGVHAEATSSSVSQKPDPQKGMVSSRIKFFEQVGARNAVEPKPSGKQDPPKGSVSARIKSLDANGARQLKERSEQNGKGKQEATNPRPSTRELEDRRPAIEGISQRLPVQERVEQLS